MHPQKSSSHVIQIRPQLTLLHTVMSAPVRRGSRQRRPPPPREVSTLRERLPPRSPSNPPRDIPTPPILGQHPETIEIESSDDEQPSTVPEVTNSDAEAPAATQAPSDHNPSSPIIINHPYVRSSASEAVLALTQRLRMHHEPDTSSQLILSSSSDSILTEIA